jgi:signal transduction histidine kinase/CheY-like chemotaxis protein
MQHKETSDGLPSATWESPFHSGELEFRRLLETLPAGAYTCDPRGLITYYNAYAVELWGRAPKLNDPGDRWCGSFKLYSSDGARIQHDQCWMALALRERRAYNGHEIIVERPDGHRLTALAHANPIYDAQGTLNGAVNVLVDISERKRAEDSLREANRSKDEFLAMLAHELRNPLAPIRNALEVLHMQDAIPVEQRWALDVIDRQSRQLARLIDDLTDISRITRQRLELRRERVAIDRVVRAAVETSRPLLNSRAHELSLVLPPAPVFLDADPTRLAQALANLLNNAAKYSERGGQIALTVEVEGPDVVVSVRDTGIGIAPEMLPRVFAMFAQGHQSGARSRDGLGIGLALVKRLVELHDGVVTAHSEGLGKGSTFTLRLPIADGPAATVRTSEAVTATTAIASRRILIVDDNVDAAATACVMLRLLGNEIRMANDGVEALAVAEEFRPDVAILDIDLPKLGGYDVARRIRGTTWGARTTIVALTGWGQDADRERALEAGFDHHFVKPVEPGELVRRIADYTAHGRPSGSRPAGETNLA